MQRVEAFPGLAALTGDPEAAALWSAEAQLAHFQSFEAAYSRALGACGLADKAAAERAAAAIETAQIDPAALVAGSLRDGLPIPALVAELKAAAGADAAAVHVGATSQDVIDSALAMTARRTTELFSQRLAALSGKLEALAASFGAAEIMGRTRMQAALPIAARHRLSVWAAGLEEAGETLLVAGDALAEIQLGGAVGDRRGQREAAGAMAVHLAAGLGLNVAERAWHANRGRVANFGAALSELTGALGKIGQDIALMAQQGVEEIALSGGGGSSAMPHKSNPVEAEVLVALARFNAAQLGGLHQALVHEQERSGAAWTLEWLLLPPMAGAAGGALALTARLLDKIERIGPTE